ncbi:hypothetical protein TH63_09770 [Rufibacter radiotolerans]|uniref:Uncharacterized protein n=1 Tax=Rufibacter radiotolerans TaxID=1379910 RepID=A0A0H4VJ69_9BACT|nr:hypothetical protein TH63_09770 [Rufibacter radiotolerans]
MIFKKESLLNGQKAFLFYTSHISCVLCPTSKSYFALSDFSSRAISTALNTSHLLFIFMA